MGIGVVIYLDDEDLNYMASKIVVDIERIRYHDFTVKSLSKDSFMKADMIVYSSKKFKGTKILSNRFGSESY